LGKELEIRESEDNTTLADLVDAQELADANAAGLVLETTPSTVGVPGLTPGGGIEEASSISHNNV